MTDPKDVKRENEWIYNTDQMVSVSANLPVNLLGETLNITITARHGAKMEGIVTDVREYLKAVMEIRKEFEKPALQEAPSAEPVMVQVTDKDGVPVVNSDHEPVMEKIDGAKVYTVAGVAHGKSKDGKRELLKVFTVEKEEFISGKYGVNCFHAPDAYKDFKSWPLDQKYAPKEGATKVVIRAPMGESKYPDVVEFRE